MLAGSSSGYGEDVPVFVISVAAELAGMHPQTLRQYDRLGLVSPGRAGGGGRRYSARDVARLREVQRLSKDDGVNLAGIKRVIELEHQVEALQARAAELAASLATAQGAASAALGLRVRRTDQGAAVASLLDDRHRQGGGRSRAPRLRHRWRVRHDARDH